MNHHTKGAFLGGWGGAMHSPPQVPAGFSSIPVAEDSPASDLEGKKKETDIQREGHKKQTLFKDPQN